jgi:hypothetical protein
MRSKTKTMHFVVYQIRDKEARAKQETNYLFRVPLCRIYILLDDLLQEMRAVVVLLPALLLASRHTACLAFISTLKETRNSSVGSLRRFVTPQTVVDTLLEINAAVSSTATKGIADSFQIPVADLADIPTILGPLAALTTALAASHLISLRNSIVSSIALQSILQGTYIGQRLQQQSRQQQPQLSLACVYKASRDGWSAMSFHEKVDDCGSGVVVAKTAFRGAVFGGFNPVGWRSTDDYTTATTAFLWCLGRAGSSVVAKYPVLPGSPAVFDYATSGPCFGAADLVIGPPQAAILGGFAGPDMQNLSLASGSLRKANILPGQAYCTDKRWPVRGYNVLLQEVEVYCLVES